MSRDLEFFQSSGRHAIGSDGSIKGDGKELQSSPTTSPGAIGTVLSEDISKVAEVVTTIPTNIVRSACSVTFATANMVTLNRSLFGLSLSIVPLIGSAAVVLNKFVKKVTARQANLKALAASFADERIVHIATVKASCREEDEVARYGELQAEISRLGRSVSMAKGAFMGFMFASASGALYFVFRSGSRAVSEGRMTQGELTSFATKTFMLGLGTSGIMRASGEFVQGFVSAKRVYSLMDGSENEKESQDHKRATKGTEEVDSTAVTSIALNKVTFAYRSHPQRTVLQDVSLTIGRGKVVALVGKNGSGKSTVASILSALYQPQSGSVLLSDGTDYLSLSRRVQSTLVQAVPQHPALFDMSITDNVRYSNPQATDVEVRAALAAAKCDGFLSQIEGGGGYVAGRDGSRLSGGQRQRLALARALLSDPCLLVLDEPTSSLDAEGETAVADAVRACQDQGRGLLLITHRAGNLELSDEVLVMAEGRIVERGPYKDLRGRKDSELCALMPDLL